MVRASHKWAEITQYTCGTGTKYYNQLCAF